MEYRNNFNFLRLFLAFLVLLSHSPEIIDGNRDREILTSLFHTISAGELAVNSFFLISGYLIVQSWQRNPQISIFFKKRVLRIYPGFIIASLISAYVVGPLGANPAEYFAKFDLLGFLRNIILLQPPYVPPVFAGTPYPLINDSMWTISYEFRCYLLVALLGVCGLVRKRVWLALSVCVLVLALSPNLFSQLAFQGSSILIGEPVSYIRFLSFFLTGGCFYLFKERIHYRAKWVFVVLPIVVLSLFNITLTQLILPTLGAYILFWFVFVPIPLLQHFKTCPDVSYGVYLYGWPIQKLLVWYVSSTSPWSLFGLSSGLSLILGWLSWKIVERPALKLK